MTGDGTALVMVRRIEASPDEVFAAWIDPALVRRWLAPASCEVAAVETDPRVGGTYRIAVVGPDGTLHVTTGEYRELVPGRRLVKTWVYHDPLPGAPVRETLLTVEFRAVSPGVTELTLRHERLMAEIDRRRVSGGWTDCLEKLATAIGSGSARQSPE